MKSVSCKDMGGSCDGKISADSPSDLANKTMDHMRQSHPDILDNMTPGDRSAWTAELPNKWNSATSI